MRIQDRWRYLKRIPRLGRNLLLQGRYEFTFDLMPIHLTNMPWSRRANYLRSGLNVVCRRQTPVNWPIFMQVEVTNYCNLRCPVCPTGLGQLERPAMNMDPELLSRLLAETSPYLMLMSLFAWGESMLHPRLDDILRITHESGVPTILSTNGQNLDDPVIQDILLRYPPTYLVVAIDGITDETNSRFRVGSRLAPILAGVRRLAECRRARSQESPRLHMRTMIMRHNEHEVPNLETFARENCFDMLSLRTLSIIDASEEGHRNLIPEDPRYRAYDYDDNHRVRRHDFICQMAFISPTVLVDGTVVACEQDFNARHPYGRLDNGRSFADIWFGDRAAGIRRIIRRDPEALSFCRNCPYADREINTCSIQSILFDSIPGRT